MLSFGFIIDNVVQIPKLYTEEEFEKRLKKTLFNAFFTEVERGCTNFYTSYQNEYTCLVLQTIKKIMDISGVNIKIHIIYPDKKSKSIIDKAIQNCSCGCMPKQVIPIIYQDDTQRDDTNFTTNDIVKQNRLQFNMLMRIVESCSSIVFYCCNKSIEENSQVHSVYNYCESYYINNINIYNKVR